MNIKVTEPVLDYEGKVIKSGKDKSLIWRDIIFQALNSVTQNEVLTGEQKAKCYRISQKVYDSNAPDLTLDERHFVLERIDKIILSPLICGRAEEFFEEKKGEGK